MDKLCEIIQHTFILFISKTKMFNYSLVWANAESRNRIEKKQPGLYTFFKYKITFIHFNFITRVRITPKIILLKIIILFIYILVILNWYFFTIV